MTNHIFQTEGAKCSVFLDGPDWDRLPTATIGAFSCKTVESGHEILSQAISFIRESGMKQVIGPMDGDTWHSYRFVTQTDDSPAFLMEPTNLPDGVAAFQSTGFIEISSYFSARAPLAQTAQTPPPDTGEFIVETWDGSSPEQLFKQVFELSCQAFAQNAFYKPITQKAFLALYMPMVPLLKRELIFFARRPDKTLVGFLFGTPNYAEGPKPRSAIAKTYASLVRGAGHQLLYAFHRAAQTEGYETAIHALIQDDNLSALRSAADGAEIFRRYGLFGLKLDG